MLFFINPAHKRTRVRSPKKPRALDRGRVSKQDPRSSPAKRSASDPARSRQDQRPTMAARRRRKARKATARKSAPRRRRRRAVTVARRRRATATTMATGRRRRRRAAVTHRNPPTRRRRRRAVARSRYRRNPGLPSTRGIVGGIIQGLKDGAAVVGGQVAARKARGAITGMLPAAAKAKVATGAGYVALSIASAIGVSLAARKFLPGQARMIAGGAWSEAINAALAQTPVAPYLGAFAPVRRLVPARGRVNNVSAWPGSGAAQLAAAGRSGVAAWPRSVGMPMNAGM